MKLQVWVVVLACITAKIIHDPNITKCIYKFCLADLLRLQFPRGNDYALGKKVFSFISSRFTTLWFYCLFFPMSLSRWKWRVDLFSLCSSYPKKMGEQLYKKKHHHIKKKKVGKSTFSHPPLRQRQFPHVSICFNTRYLNGSFGFNSLLTSSGPVTPQLGSINLERPSWIHSTKQSHLDLWNPVEGALSW